MFGRHKVAKTSKNLARAKNNFVRLSEELCRTLNRNEQCCKKFWHSSLNVLHEIILMVQTKLFSDLCLAKFLDISAKPFLSCSA